MTFMIGKYQWYYLVPFVGFAIAVKAQGLSWSVAENVFLYAGLGFFFSHFDIRAANLVVIALAVSIPAEWLMIFRFRSRRFRWEEYTLSNYLLNVSYVLEFLLFGILLGL